MRPHSLGSTDFTRHFAIVHATFSLHPAPRIPMTTTGKIDRKTLRGIGSTIDSVQANTLVIGDEEKRIPSSERELVLQRLWSQILNIEASEISADDS